MKILLIEDDEMLCHNIIFHLKKEGYTLDSCLDGAEGLYYIQQYAYDLIILDRMLPSLNGINILKRIRAQGIKTPVILVTALTDINDRVTGLDSGADDYLAKPFFIEELLARIRALSRRPSEWTTLQSISLGNTTLNLNEHILSGPQTSCSLSKKEYEIAQILFKRPNQILHRDTLIDLIWGSDSAIESGNLDNYIHFIRRRLKVVNSNLNIKTIRSIGFTLEVPI